MLNYEYTDMFLSLTHIKLVIKQHTQIYTNKNCEVRFWLLSCLNLLKRNEFFKVKNKFSN